MFTAVTEVDSGIITCMMTDCLSINTSIPTITNKNCISDYRVKIIDSLRTRNIEMGLLRPAAQPDLGPRAEHMFAQTVENSVPNVGIQHAEQKPDLPLTVNDNTQILASSESLSSDDTVSSTNYPANAMQLFNPSIVSTNVVASDRISVLMNKSQMQLLKAHTTTLTTSKRAYTCAHCSGLGHTRSHYLTILSGNQRVMPAKTLVPGDYIVYWTPAISNQRINYYNACDLIEYPRELHPDSSSTLSPAEHSLFQSITDDEIEKENTTRISPKDPPLGTTQSCIISRTQLVTLKKSSLIKDTNYDLTNEQYTATVQELIKSSANCTVTNVRCNTSSIEQKYELGIGTKIESVQRFFQLDPNVHLNSAALSQENQSSVRVPIPTIDSQSFLSQLKLITKSFPSSVRARECISITGCKYLIDFLVTYLEYDPELKRPLPLFRLLGKTLPFTEGQRIISYENIPNGCGITLESL